MGAPHARRLLALLGPERRCCAVVAALMAASVLGEMAIPYFTGRVTDWVASEDEVAAAWPMALLGLSSAITEFTCDVTYTGMLSRVLGQLQRRVFAAVLRRDVASLRVTGTGAVTARVTGDVEATHAAVSEALSILLWYLARGVCLLVTMAWLSPHLAFVTLLSLPILLLLPRGIGKLQQGLSQRVQEALAGATKVAVETFQAMATVRSFAHEARAAERYHQHLRHIYGLEWKESATYATTLWASGFSALALKLGLLCYGGQLVAAGTITTGDLVTFLIYQMQFTEAVRVLLLYYPNMTKAVGSSEKIFEFLDQEKQVAPTGTLAPDVLRGHLKLEDVWFSYPGHQEPILKGVSLELHPGEVLAVVAPPGAGKSTLISLVLNLHPPEAGRVLLDGHPLPAYQHPYLRCQVAAVPQEPVLFSRSLHANIAYGPGSWSRAQVTVAARRAGAHAFITRLPRGYDTEVGELGGQLSGGQQQGVAIARALVRNPRVLVLDEPTSALDTESQLQVEQEIFGASGAGRAVLLVTGQVALAMRAQRVAVLEGGRLHELESPEELLCPGSRYWHLLQGGGQGGTAGDGDMGDEGGEELGMGTPRDGDTRSHGGGTRDRCAETRSWDGDNKSRDEDNESWDGVTSNQDGDTTNQDGETKSWDGDSESCGGDTESCDKGPGEL
ncbi:LOW QUALITY PROTEIN: antigen peptide transporter 1 [Phalacrocorax aristotelis]|uniref:LOW QUALITY PROTEIN: antigen peptide transporter 1 n=1 Tax=Phalacrocorax aristotelis TaxID=126867 RepID=UPI003F4B500F